MTLNPIDMTDADWELLDLLDTGDPDCPKCGEPDPWLTVKAPTRADRREAYKCAACGNVVRYGY